MIKKTERVEKGGCCYFCEMTMAMLTVSATVIMMATIDYCSLFESNGMIVATLYFLFIFNECKEEFVGGKGNGRREGKSGLIFIISMVTVKMMATTTIAMIDCCSFYDSNGTMAVIIYIFFHIR